MGQVETLLAVAVLVSVVGLVASAAATVALAIKYGGLLADKTILLAAAASSATARTEADARSVSELATVQKRYDDLLDRYRAALALLPAGASRRELERVLSEQDPADDGGGADRAGTAVHGSGGPGHAASPIAPTPSVRGPLPGRGVS